MCHCLILISFKSIVDDMQIWILNKVVFYMYYTVIWMYEKYQSILTMNTVNLKSCSVLVFLFFVCFRLCCLLFCYLFLVVMNVSLRNYLKRLHFGNLIHCCIHFFVWGTRNEWEYANMSIKTYFFRTLCNGMLWIFPMSSSCSY